MLNGYNFPIVFRFNDGQLFEENDIIEITYEHRLMEIKILTIIARIVSWDCREIGEEVIVVDCSKTMHSDVREIPVKNIKIIKKVSE